MVEAPQAIDQVDGGLNITGVVGSTGGTDIDKYRRRLRITIGCGEAARVVILDSLQPLAENRPGQPQRKPGVMYPRVLARPTIHVPLRRGRMLMPLLCVATKRSTSFGERKERNACGLSLTRRCRYVNCVVRYTPMSFAVGIVGLPNVGKSSLFQILTKKQVDTSNYPFATIDPNVGVVAVPDPRLDVLTKMEKSAKTIATTIEFVDIAGLVKDAHKGEGLGNQFLANIREVDAIAEVVRAFDDPNVIHVAGKIDPASDTATIDIELAMADLSTVAKRLDTLTKQKKAGLNKQQAAELALVERVHAHLSDGKPVRILSLVDEERLELKSLNLLTIKPLIYILNVSENQVATTKAETYGLPPEQTVVIAVKVEQELASLSTEDASAYLKDLGLSASGLDRLIQTAYRTLGLVTFLTTGPDETRAWTVPTETPAPKAAAVIHTDFEQHFIRAEVVTYDELVRCGSWENAKTSGKLRIEGKEYVIQDGDVLFFRVNV